MTREADRNRMVSRQIENRGVRDEAVLEAMRSVPRERFVPEAYAEFAYDDTPLPIEEGQTISQPYIVAVMAEALDLRPGDRVLEVGAGSGYAAAVIGQIAEHVYAIERYRSLARSARVRIEALGYGNVEIVAGDGTLGLPEHAPFDAIAVAAGGPEVPKPLLEQLAVGGRLVIPVGDETRAQELVRVTRLGEHEFEETSLGRVQFVPLIGSAGWALDGASAARHRAGGALRISELDRSLLVSLVHDGCEPFGTFEQADLGPLLERIGDARVVLIGEASHGTSEFYRMRARITRELIERKGFNIVAIEGDWPDVAAIDAHVRPDVRRPPPGRAFSRFPTWMWRNEETREFVDWLYDYNTGVWDLAHQVAVYGLDLYSLGTSIDAVLDFLRSVDSEAAEIARIRYGCFSPWETDPAVYGRAVSAGRLEACEDEVLAVLTDLLARRVDYERADGASVFDAERNATVVREAERYYRVMYRGSRESWNLRDTHMFDVLQATLAHRGDDARAVVWAHNSHVGNARATEMGRRGELNIGQLAKEAFQGDAYSIGFGTHEGTVAAASNWGEPMQYMTIRPSHQDSYERLCHDTGLAGFLLPLRDPAVPELREALLEPHLERAIGVIYRPESELVSHYFQAALPAQFDEYVWIETTDAVAPLETEQLVGIPETYPFAL
ncbi:MAG: protein-L-isoaspartate O-methyltransferase [Gemmatimonas sp. SG8_23]|nr:MAG: protein-L-isoaspartate O-methyltransferase [Gemmatimonas sp. SG8_23]